MPRRAPLPGGSERILVAEDNDEVREGVVSQLQSLGYDVSEAADGSAALGKLEAAARPYDLLLTDVIMPGPMNGKALADEVARRWPGTKIVFMSGYTENAIIHEGRLESRHPAAQQAVRAARPGGDRPPGPGWRRRFGAAGGGVVF